MTLRILGGQFKGRILRSPKSSPTRPTQGILRQSLFNICQHAILNARFLDLFAGSGAMGLEALSHGAKRAIFVEQNKSAAAVIRENIHTLQVIDRSELLAMDVLHALKLLAKRQETFDIIYIDPPYGQPDLIQSVLEEIEKNNLVLPEALIFFETSAQEQSIDYKSTRLKKASSRIFGIARLDQYISI
jgi:16S rRNA (guanine966-N2)-methyltransferase